VYLSGVLFKASERVCLRRRCQIPQLDAAIPTGRCKNVFILLCMSSCTLFMFANAALQCIDIGVALHLPSASKVEARYLQVSGLQSAPRSMHNHRDHPWCQMQQSGLVLAVMPALDILAVRHYGSQATQQLADHRWHLQNVLPAIANDTKILRRGDGYSPIFEWGELDCISVEVCLEKHSLTTSANQGLYISPSRLLAIDCKIRRGRCIAKRVADSQAKSRKRKQITGGRLFDDGRADCLFTQKSAQTPAASSGD